MRVWKEMYGCDADGNRGEMRSYAELEECDEMEVRQAILEQYDGSDQYLIEINGFEFEVFASEWFSYEELDEIEGI